MVWLASIIIFAPLLGFLIAILWGRRMGEPKGAIAPIAALGVSFAAAVALFVRILLGHGGDFSYTWFQVGDFTLHVGFQLDRFGGVMALVVATVSFMIHIYSTGYMAGDKLYSRYFAYLNLFSAAMLGLVLANNFLQAFIFWELVGLTSYLLIGFWFEKPEAANAGMKAVITTRLGDVGLLVGIILIFTLLYGQWQITSVVYVVGQGVGIDEKTPDPLNVAVEVAQCSNDAHGQHDDQGAYNKAHTASASASATLGSVRGGFGDMGILGVHTITSTLRRFPA